MIIMSLIHLHGFRCQVKLKCFNLWCRRSTLKETCWVLIVHTFLRYDPAWSFGICLKFHKNWIAQVPENFFRVLLIISLERVVLLHLFLADLMKLAVRKRTKVTFSIFLPHKSSSIGRFSRPLSDQSLSA